MASIAAPTIGISRRSRDIDSAAVQKVARVPMSSRYLSLNSQLDRSSSANTVPCPPVEVRCSCHQTVYSNETWSAGGAERLKSSPAGNSSFLIWANSTYTATGVAAQNHQKLALNRRLACGAML